MNPNHTTATIVSTSPRAADWEKVFGRLTDIPLKGPLPLSVNVPGKPQSLAYLLDLDALSIEQVERLIGHLANRFQIDPTEVRQELPRGVPVLAEDVVVSIPQGIAFSMMVDDLDDNDDLDDIGRMTDNEFDELD